MKKAVRESSCHPLMDSHKAKTDHLPDQWKKYIISGACCDISIESPLTVAYVYHMKKPSEIIMTDNKQTTDLRHATLNH